MPRPKTQHDQTSQDSTDWKVKTHVIYLRIFISFIYGSFTPERSTQNTILELHIAVRRILVSFSLVFFVFFVSHNFYGAQNVRIVE